MSTPLQSVAAVAPVAPYVGGKRNLARRITNLIGSIPHKTYAEPFVGMGGIFLRRKHRPKCEVINDISEDVTSLFLILQEHYAYFVDHLRFRLSSRAEFERLAAQDPKRSRMTDLNRAARFLYLQRLAFGGKVTGRTFGVTVNRPSHFNVTQLEPMLAEVHERLASVTIERLPWADFIARYDDHETLFYLDPPYFGNETFYGKGLFDRDDFTVMASRLAAIKGKFLLSINDTPDVRAIFAGFNQMPVSTRYSVSGSAEAKSRTVGELIVSNVPLPANDCSCR